MISEKIFIFLQIEFEFLESIQNISKTFKQIGLRAERVMIGFVNFFSVQAEINNSQQKQGG